MSRKSLLALLLVMVMACCAVLSAGAEAFTITVSAHVNGDAVTQLAALSGTDIAAQLPAGAMDAVLGLVDKLAFRATIDGSAVQADVLVSDQSLTYVAGQIGEDGITVVTDLLPSYAVHISSEELEQFLSQMSSGMASSGMDMNSFNPEDIQYLIEAAVGPVTGLISKVVSSFGPAETGSWDFSGKTFTSRAHLDMTTKEIGLAGLEAASSFLQDAKVQSILSGFGVKPEELDLSGAVQSVQNSSDDDLPVLDVYQYISDSGDMYFTLNLLKNEEGFIAEGGMVDGQFILHLNTNPDMFEIDATAQQNGEFYLFFGLNMKAVAAGGDTPFNDMCVEVTGKNVGETFNVDISYKFDTTEFMALNMAFGPGGQITADFGTAGKNVLGLQDVMGLAQGGSTEVLDGIKAEISAQAMQLVTKLMALAPDEVTQLMTLVMNTGR